MNNKFGYNFIVQMKITIQLTNLFLNPKQNVNYKDGNTRLARAKLGEYILSKQVFLTYTYGLKCHIRVSMIGCSSWPCACLIASSPPPHTLLSTRTYYQFRLKGANFSLQVNLTWGRFSLYFGQRDRLLYVANRHFARTACWLARHTNM